MLAYKTILLILSLLIWTSLESKGIYLKSRYFTQKKDLKLSEIAKIDSEIQDRIIYSNLDSPILINVESIRQLFPDKNVQILGKECLVIPFHGEFTKIAFEDSLRSEIVKRNSILEDQFKLEYTGQNIKLPAKGVSYVWANFPKNLSPGNRIFSLDIYYEGKKIYTQRLKFVYKIKQKIAIASVDIPRSTKITTEMINYKVEFSEFEEKDVFSGNLEGMTVLTSIRIGDTIRKKHVRKLFDVQNGTHVELIFIKGSLILKGRGLARKSGNIGDQIPVKGHSGSTILEGTIVSRGVVRID